MGCDKDYLVITTTDIRMLKSTKSKIETIADEEDISFEEYVEEAVNEKLARDMEEKNSTFCSAYPGEDTIDKDHINLWDIQTALFTLQEVCESFISDGCDGCPLYSEMNRACGCEHLDQNINTIVNKVHRFFD